MTIKQVSVVLGLKVRTVRSWITKGKLKAIKLGSNRWDIPEEEIYREEIQDRANKGREHSRRIKKGIEMGMLQRAGQDTKEPV